MENVMCLAVPAKIVEITDDKAVCDILGNKREANLALVEQVDVGDYVLLHAGYAIEKLEKEDAEATLSIFSELESEVDENV